MPHTIPTQTGVIGDALELMADAPDKYFDLVVTDPPYGVGMDYGGYVDSEDNWYDLMDRFIPEACRIGKMVIFPSCQIKRLGWFYDNHPPDWIIVWYKGSPGTAGYIGFNDWDPLLVYGKNKGVSMHDHFYCKPEPFTCGHPCPKPIGWAEWIISRATKPGATVLDPFLGSGTTLAACRRTGRHGVGYELNPLYEPIIRKRCMADTPDLFSY